MWERKKKKLRYLHHEKSCGSVIFTLPRIFHKFEVDFLTAIGWFPRKELVNVRGSTETSFSILFRCWTTASTYKSKKIVEATLVWQIWFMEYVFLFTSMIEKKKHIMKLHAIQLFLICLHVCIDNEICQMRCCTHLFRIKIHTYVNKLSSCYTFNNIKSKYRKKEYIHMIRSDVKILLLIALKKKMNIATYIRIYYFRRYVGLIMSCISNISNIYTHVRIFIHI